MKPVFGWIAMVLAISLCSGNAADKKILLIAGRPSHGPGDHEFRAGCLLLQDNLSRVPGINVTVHTNGWPDSDAAFEGADAVVIYADGGGGHPAIQEDRISLMDQLAKNGVNIGCMHYGVEVPAGEAGEAMMRWIGGHYEHKYSVNPMWQPDFNQYPQHPVARGVRPFSVLDEWYFNMRWNPNAKALTHLLADVPSDDVRDGPYVYPNGPYDHIVAASGERETMMWAFERSDGGRGFGFTGGHKHVNWYNDDYRKIVLNAILWIAKVEVPEGGVQSKLEPIRLSENLDPKRGSNELVNITGRWVFDVKIGDNGGQPEMLLVQAGHNLLGEYDGYFGTKQVIGRVSENSVTIQLEVDWEGNKLPVRYSGVLSEQGQMEGSVKMGDQVEGTWTARKQ